MAEPVRIKSTEQALARFAVLANKASLHPYDWNRFYAFVSIAHQFRSRWNHLEVAAKLKTYGFSDARARELSEIYWHGRCVLQMRKADFRRAEYSRWSSGPPLT